MVEDHLVNQHPPCSVEDNFVKEPQTCVLGIRTTDETGTIRYGVWFEQSFQIENEPLPGLWQHKGRPNRWCVVVTTLAEMNH